MITEIKDNIFINPPDVICHCCNCFHVMGAGIAKEITSRWSEVYKKDKTTDYASRLKLGTIGVVKLENCTKPSYIINMYGQFEYGKVQRYLDYEAFYKCLIKLRDFMKEKPDLVLGIPYKIGCGLAGGDWNIVKTMIYSVFERELTVQTKIYSY